LDRGKCSLNDKRYSATVKKLQCQPLCKWNYKCIKLH